MKYDNNAFNYFLIICLGLYAVPATFFMVRRLWRTHKQQQEHLTSASASTRSASKSTKPVLEMSSAHEKTLRSHFDKISGDSGRVSLKQLCGAWLDRKTSGLGDSVLVRALFNLAKPDEAGTISSDGFVEFVKQVCFVETHELRHLVYEAVAGPSGLNIADFFSQYPVKMTNDNAFQRTLEALGKDVVSRGDFVTSMQSSKKAVASLDRFRDCMQEKELKKSYWVDARNAAMAAIERSKIQASKPVKSPYERLFTVGFIVHLVILAFMLILMAYLFSVVIEDTDEEGVDLLEQYFRTLNLDSDATDSQIRSSYRKLSKEHHPDKGGDEEMFMAIAKAYEALIDPEARENLKTVGNEDGRVRPWDGGIALPSWLLLESSRKYIAAVYAIALGVIIPGALWFYYKRNAGLDDKGLLVESRQLIEGLLFYALPLKHKDFVPVIAHCLEFLQTTPLAEESKEVDELAEAISSRGGAGALAPFPTTHKEPRIFDWVKEKFSKVIEHGSPHRCNVLLTAHMWRIPRPTAKMEHDLVFILTKADTMMNVMCESVFRLVRLPDKQQHHPNFIKNWQLVMEFRQRIVQAIAWGGSPLLQLPYFTAIHTAKHKDVKSMLDFTNPSTRKNLLRSFTDGQQEEIEDVMDNRLPFYTLKPRMVTLGDKDIHVGDVSTIIMRVEAVNFKGSGPGPAAPETEEQRQKADALVRDLISDDEADSDDEEGGEGGGGGEEGAGEVKGDDGDDSELSDVPSDTEEDPDDSWSKKGRPLQPVYARDWPEDRKRTNTWTFVVTHPAGPVIGVQHEEITSSRQVIRLKNLRIMNKPGRKPNKKGSPMDKHKYTVYASSNSYLGFDHRIEIEIDVNTVPRKLPDKPAPDSDDEDFEDEDNVDGGVLDEEESDDEDSEPEPIPEPTPVPIEDTGFKGTEKQRKQRERREQLKRRKAAAREDGDA